MNIENYILKELNDFSKTKCNIIKFTKVVFKDNNDIVICAGMPILITFNSFNIEYKKYLIKYNILPDKSKKIDFCNVIILTVLKLIYFKYYKEYNVKFEF